MKVISKQTNSRDCLICGVDNENGLKANFYNLEDGSVGSLFTFKFNHQSYPDRVHGGMISALLDELAGRALWVTNPELVGVTGNLNVRFKKPVPYNKPLKGRGIITSRRGKVFTAKGEILDENNCVLAESEATYIIIPNTQIATDSDLQNDLSIMVEDNITEIDF